MPPRKNQTFWRQQNIWIVTNYREFKSPTALTSEFRKHFKVSLRLLSTNLWLSVTSLFPSFQVLSNQFTCWYFISVSHERCSLIPGQIILRSLLYIDSRELNEVGFSSIRIFTVSMSSSIILVREDLEAWKKRRHRRPWICW